MKLRILLVCAILIASFIVRLYHFNGPMADLHSWRQSDTAAVARNLTRHNFDVLHPQIDSAVSIDGIGRDNTPRYHFAEFPLYQLFTAWTSLLTDDIVKAGRIVSIVCSLVSIFVLYLLARRYYNENVALIAAAIYGLLPFNIFWSRTILPDNMMLMFSLLSLYFWDRYIRDHEHVLDLVLTVIFFAGSILLKAFSPFLLLPMFYLAWRKYGKKVFNKYLLWVGIIVAFVPFVMWRWWMQQWPMSIPASGWLFDGSHLRFKPAWYHWIFQIRLDQYMFNFSGAIFIGIAAYFYKEVYEATKTSDERRPQAIWFFPLCLLVCLIYLIVFATGNVQHEYYQLPITPFGSVFVALGFWYVWTKRGTWYEMSTRRIVSMAMLGITLLLGWYVVKDWYIIGNPMLITVGQRADAILPKTAKVVADYGGDTTFLYYINRPGWSVRDKQLQEMIDRGATNYISMHRTEYINKLARLYRVVDETKEYVIIDLTQKTDDPEWQNIKPYEL